MVENPNNPLEPGFVMSDKPVHAGDGRDFSASDAAVKAFEATLQTPPQMTREEAQTKRDGMMRNADFRERYTRGESGALRAMAEVNSVLGRIEDRQTAEREISARAFTEWFPLNSEQVAEIAENRIEKPEVIREARRMLDRCLADPAWRDKALNNPNSEERKQMGLLSSVLSRAPGPG